MTEQTKEQEWKEEARKAYQDQQSQDNEGGCREPIGFVQGYLAAKKSGFEEIKNLNQEIVDLRIILKACSNEEKDQEIKTLKEQLAEAESVLGYYGNSENYYLEYRGDHLCRNVICKEDISSIDEIRDPYSGRIAIKYCGGNILTHSLPQQAVL